MQRKNKKNESCHRDINFQNALNNEIPLADIISAVGLCIVFGSSFVAVKASFSGFGVFTSMAMRFFIASAAIFVWAKATGKSLRIERVYFVKIFVWTCIFLVEYSLLFFGISKTSASRASLIANLQPFFVIILTHFFIAGEKIVFRKIFGMLVGFCGVLPLFIFREDIAADFAIGDIVILAMAFCWAFKVVFLKSFINKVSVIAITFYHITLSVPVFLGEAFFFDKPMIKAFSVATLCSVLYQGLVVSAFGFIAWNFLIKKHQVSMIHSFLFIVPLSGVFFGIALLGEAWTLNILFASLLIVSGLFIVHYPEKSKS